MPSAAVNSSGTKACKEKMKTKTIFIPGARYRAKRPFGAGDVDKFEVGEVVVFESHFYSIYDSAFCYYFVRENDAAMKRWWLGDEEPEKLWTDDFELLGPGKPEISRSPPTRGPNPR